MAVKFRKVQRKIMIGDDAGKTKTFAVAKANGYCDLNRLCKLVSARSSISSADVKAVLDSLNWAMDLELQSGHIVQLGEFGNFRLTVQSDGEEDEKAFSASNIRKARVVFYPGSSLRITSRDVHFQQEEPYVVEKSEKEDGEDGGDGIL